MAQSGTTIIFNEKDLVMNNQHNLAKNKNYVDLLSLRRAGSDVRFSLKEWNPTTSYKYANHIPRDVLFSKVLNSDRVQKAIDEVSFSIHYLLL